MKKIIALLVFAAGASQSFAQTPPTPTPAPQPPVTVTQTPVGASTNRIRIGLQFSPEITWLHPKENGVSNNGTGVGFSFGPMLDFGFANNYAFGTGINIVNVPGSLTYNDDSTQFNSFKGITYYKGTKVKYSPLKYIEIPLLLRLHTNEIGYLTYYGFFGFVPGFKYGVKGSIQNSNGQNNKVDENLGPDITFLNLSLQVGAGVAYSLTTTTSLYIGVSFVNGFIDVTDNPSGFTANNSAVLNRIPISVGVWF